MIERNRKLLPKFEQVVEMVNEGIWTVDADDRTEYINRNGAAMLGYEPNEVLGRSPADFFIPEAKEDLWWLRELRSGRPASFEIGLRHKDGSTVWISALTRPIISSEGTYQGALNVFSNVTERRRTEESLHASQQMLSLVLDNVPDRVFWKDRQLNYLGCNRNAARDAGLDDPSEIVGKSDYQLAWKELADAYRADDRQVMESGIPKLNFEEPQVNKEGVRWLRTNKVPLRDPTGNVIGVMGTYEDITDRKAAEKRLEEYARQLERSNEELQQFAYVASHDLKEPLRMVSLSLDLMRLKHGDELGVEASEYLGTAFEGAGRMRQLINDLLTYSRVETQAREFNAVDMNSVAKAALRDLEVAVSESKAEVIVNELPTVLADEVQMEQLLLNLISNAVKYRDASSPRIEISCSVFGDEFVFMVQDNGIGIDPKYIPGLFRMFYRLHSRDEYTGTGIGLAICKKIVERHGGRIWVESDGRCGSTFFFTLPSLSAPVSRLLG